MTCDSAGATRLLQSGGMFEARAERQGEGLRLRAGKAIELAYPPTRRGEDFNFYALDEATGQWNFRRAFGAEMAPQTDTLYYPLGLLAPPKGNWLKLKLKPGDFDTDKNKRAVEALAIACEGNKSRRGSAVFRQEGKFLVDSKTGVIDTLQPLNWEEYLSAFQCGASDVAALGAEASWVRRPRIRKETAFLGGFASSNVFAGCMRVALNDLQMTSGKVRDYSYVSFGCQIVCNQAAYFLFLRTCDGKIVGGSPLDAIIGLNHEEKWENARTSRIVGTTLHKKNPTEYEIRAREICAALARGPDSVSCPALTAEQARQMARAALRPYAPAARFVAGARATGVNTGGVSMRLPQLGAYNIDRMMMAEPLPKYVPLLCALSLPDSGGAGNDLLAPAYGTLFCYRRKAQVMQTYPAFWRTKGHKEMYGSLHVASQNWDLVGLALEDGRVALLAAAERRKLAVRAAQGRSNVPLRLDFRFGETRVLRIEDLRALLKGGA